MFKGKQIKVQFLALLVIFMGVAFASCNKDKVDDNSYSKDIVGTWEVTGYSLDGSQYSNWIFGASYFTFNSDGTFKSMDGMFEDGAGTYKIEDSVLKLTSEEGLKINLEIVELTSTTAKFRVGADAFAEYSEYLPGISFIYLQFAKK